MTGFFARQPAELSRVLLIESCSREVGELLLQRFYGKPALARLDVLTCYPSAPSALDTRRSQLLSVHGAEAAANRRAFLKSLCRGPYDAVAIVCSGSGVLSKWKWAIAAKTRARIVFADETGQWFPFDMRHLPALAVLLLRRSNIASLPHLLWTIASILVAPFTVLFLAIYTLLVHLRRLWRIVESRT